MEPQTLLTVQNLAYLLASMLFIFGLKGLTHPRSAVRGNLMGSFAMLLAVVATLAGTGIISWGLIIIGLAVGSVIGTIMALKVPMTGMPQMVAVFNGFGGGASFLVAGAELIIQLSRGQAGAEGAAVAHAVGYVGALSVNDLKRLDPTRYAGTAHAGKTGIENSFEMDLHGDAGYQHIITNARGRQVPADSRNLSDTLPTDKAPDRTSRSM